MGGAYLITFVCYGSHIPGQEGTVDRRQNCFGAPSEAADADLLKRSGDLMREHPYRMDARRRAIVLQSFAELCIRRHWTLLAAHIRLTHLHVVVEADRSPERVMTALKASASASLNRLAVDERHRRRWARHGSTRYLWSPQDLSAAIHYVVCNQGEPMDVYVAARWRLLRARFCRVR